MKRVATSTHDAHDIQERREFNRHGRQKGVDNTADTHGGGLGEFELTVAIGEIVDERTGNVEFAAW